MGTVAAWLLLLLSFGASCASTYDFNVIDVFNSATNVTVGLAKGLDDNIPSPDELLRQSKQLLAGYPAEALANVLNSWCSTALQSKVIVPRIVPDVHKMHFQFRTACKNYSYPLLKSERIWRNPHFDPSHKVVILATGWGTTINNSNPVDAFAKAFNCRGGVNFLAIDAASYVDTLYSWSALNTETIGEYIAQGLVELVKIVPVENIHLIGHSLGAHIVGSAGRNFIYLTGRSLPRITGLDPAKLCFNEGESLAGLQRGDAQFVDVIHTNAGVLSKRDIGGDADFYPGGAVPIQPGCISIACSHGRAWEYFVESIYNEDNFLGKRCTSLGNVRRGTCKGDWYRMGFAARSDLKGSFFLDVNDRSPYGQNASSPTSDNNCEWSSCSEKGKSVQLQDNIKSPFGMLSKPILKIIT